MKNKPIRDIVHDYIDLTPIEQTVVDRPKFQRLRFVTQNSSAYLTFPCNTGTRFPHSLGVMHLSGKMLLRAFENAEPAILKAYLQTLYSYIKRQIISNTGTAPKDIQVAARSLLGNSCRFGGLSGSSEPLTPEESFTVLLVWQAVRLCAMIHDIGHLPMSHVFEYAIENFHSRANKGSVITHEFIRRKKEWLDGLDDTTRIEFEAREKEDPAAMHEWIGMQLFVKMLPTSKDQGFDVDQHGFCMVVYKLAQLIFVTRKASTEQLKSNGAECLGCLHAIISSGLDADRLDYCMRDPQVSGLELGAYDLKRIVDSLILVQDADKVFKIVLSSRSVSAIESFFHQRYLMYKYLIYHHNVARLDGVVKDILVEILLDAEEGTSKTIEIVSDKYCFFAKSRKPDESFSFEEYERFDDSWLRTFFTNLLFELIKLDQNRRVLREHKLITLLDTFLYRKTINLYSFWKTDSEYTSFMTDAYNIYKQKVNDPITFSDFDLRFRTDVSTNPYIFFTNFESFLQEKFTSCIPIGRSVKPKGVGPNDGVEVLISDGNNSLKLVPVTELSPYLEELSKVAQLVPSIHLSVVYEGIKSTKNRDIIAQMREKSLHIISEYVRNIAL